MQKSIKNCAFFWGCDFERILGGFWEAKIHDFRCFVREKTDAKNKKTFGRQTNRILRPQSKLRTKCGGPCGSGVRNKRMGEGTWGRHFGVLHLKQALEAGTIGR